MNVIGENEDIIYLISNEWFEKCSKYSDKFKDPYEYIFKDVYKDIERSEIDNYEMVEKDGDLYFKSYKLLSKGIKTKKQSKYDRVELLNIGLDGMSIYSNNPMLSIRSHNSKPFSLCYG